MKKIFAFYTHSDIVHGMQVLLSIIQIILSVLLVIAILLQNTGSGIEGALGGGDSSVSVHNTRRGFEKFLFHATIVIAVLFALSALLPLIL